MAKKKFPKYALTKNKGFATLPAMPASTKPDFRSKVARANPVNDEQVYRKYFAASPSPSWRHENDNFSLEQPSPFQVVPTETTYGMDSTLCPTIDA